MALSADADASAEANRADERTLASLAAELHDVRASHVAAAAAVLNTGRQADMNSTGSPVR
mgnify:CR=1 FL=1